MGVQEEVVRFETGIFHSKERYRQQAGRTDVQWNLCYAVFSQFVWNFWWSLWKYRKNFSLGYADLKISAQWNIQNETNGSLAKSS